MADESILLQIETDEGNTPSVFNQLESLVDKLISSFDKMSSVVASMSESVTSAFNGINEAASKMGQSAEKLGSSFSELNTEAAESATTLERSSEAAEENAHSLSDVANSAEKADANLKPVHESSKNIISSFLDMGSKIGMTVFGFQQLYDGAVGLASGLFSSNASMEQTKIAFTGLLGSGEAANAMLEKMKAFSASTPFEFPELAQTTQKLMAFGFAAQDCIPILTDVGDAVSGLGGGQAEIDRVVYALGQMHSAGKLSTEDMNQLTDVGISGWQMLADATGKTTAQVRDMVEKGLIPADQAITMLRAGMHEAFGGQMQAQSQSFNGLVSTIKDNINLAWMAFTGPLFEKAKGALLEFGNIISGPQFSEMAKSLGEGIGNAVTLLVNNFDKLKPVLIGVAAAITSALIPAVGSAVVAFGALMTEAAPFIAIGAAVAGLVVIFQHFYETNAQFKASVDDIVGKLQQFGSSLTQHIPALLQFGQSIGSNVLGVLQNLGSAVLPVLQNAWNSIQGALQSVMPLWSSLQDLFVQLQPVLQLIATILGVVLVTAIGVVVGVINGLAGAFKGIIQVVQGVVQVLSGFVEILVGIFTLNGDKIKDGFSKIWDGIKNIVTGALSAIGGLIGGFFSGIGKYFEGFGINIGQALQNAWNGIKTAVGTFFNGLGTSIHQKLEEIKNGFVNAWNLIKTAVEGKIVEIKIAIETKIASIKQGVEDKINGIKQAFSDGFDKAKQIVQTVVEAIVGFFQWLYDHNYYFQALVDFIVDRFNFAKDTITTIWTAITAFLSTLWNTISTTAQTIWTVITTTISTALQNAWNIVTSIGNAIMSTLQSVWSAVSSAASAAWNTIVSVISGALNSAWSTVSSIGSAIISTLQSAWSSVVSGAQSTWSSFVGAITGAIGPVASAVGSIVSTITSTLSGIASQALSWGANIISGLIQGIQSMIGSLGDTVGNVASTISGALGFHSPPKEGPASDSDTWMPNMINMMTKGLDDNKYRLTMSVNAIANQMMPLGGMGTGSTSSGSNSEMVALQRQIITLLQRQPSGSTSNSAYNTTMNNTINGVTDINALYRALNAQAGYASEWAKRGAIAGLGV